jgi:hypothetical protein
MDLAAFLESKFSSFRKRPAVFHCEEDGYSVEWYSDGFISLRIWPREEGQQELLVGFYDDRGYWAIDTYIHPLQLPHYIDSLMPLIKDRLGEHSSRINDCI